MDVGYEEAARLLWGRISSAMLRRSARLTHPIAAQQLPRNAAVRVRCNLFGTRTIDKQWPH
jgi:hypothetical protein